MLQYIYQESNMNPDFSDEPTVRAAIQLNEARARSVSLTHRLMFYVTDALRAYCKARLPPPTGRSHRLQR
jgi:hypothetical protein